MKPSPEKKLSEETSSTMDISNINRLSASELTNLLRAIQDRASSLKEEASQDDSSEASQDSSQQSVNAYGYEDLQDAQDPYA